MEKMIAEIHAQYLFEKIDSQNITNQQKIDIINKIIEYLKDQTILHTK